MRPNKVGNYSLRSQLFPRLLLLAFLKTHLRVLEQNNGTPTALWQHLWLQNYALPGYYSASSGTFLPLKTGPIGCPETSVTNYQYTARNDPEERSSRLHRGGSQISRISGSSLRIWTTLLEPTSILNTPEAVHFVDSYRSYIQKLEVNQLNSGNF
jgi:hypothetical protein